MCWLIGYIIACFQHAIYVFALGVMLRFWRRSSAFVFVVDEVPVDWRLIPVFLTSSVLCSSSVGTVCFKQILIQRRSLLRLACAIAFVGLRMVAGSISLILDDSSPTTRTERGLRGTNHNNHHHYCSSGIGIVKLSTFLTLFHCVK